MTAPRLAATVVVLRPRSPSQGQELASGATQGPPEVLMVRRSRGASFMADAYVFPGGRVDEADGSDGVEALRRAAARELLEEAAVEIDAATLVAFSRWVTPSAEPKRFDASFFVAVVPAGTEARADEAEVTERVWATARELLARHASSSPSSRSSSRRTACSRSCSPGTRPTPTPPARVRPSIPRARSPLREVRDVRALATSCATDSFALRIDRPGAVFYAVAR